MRYVFAKKVIRRIYLAMSLYCNISSVVSDIYQWRHVTYRIYKDAKFYTFLLYTWLPSGNTSSISEFVDIFAVLISSGCTVMDVTLTSITGSTGTVFTREMNGACVFFPWFEGARRLGLFSQWISTLSSLTTTSMLAHFLYIKKPLIAKKPLGV